MVLSSLDINNLQRVGEVPVQASAPEPTTHSFIAYMYGLDSSGQVLVDAQGKPLWESQNGVLWIAPATAFSTKKPAGYFMVNTGNPAKDAVATIALNEVGLDNYVRAVDALTKGMAGEGFRHYGIAAREATFAAAEIRLTLTGVGGILKAASKTPKALFLARKAPGQAPAGGTSRFGFNEPGGFLNRTKTALFGGQFVDAAGSALNPARTIWRNGQRVVRPGGPAIQTRPNAFAAVVNNYKNHGVIGGTSATVRSTAKAIKSGFNAILPKGQRAGRVAVSAYPASIAARAGMGRLAAQAGGMPDGRPQTDETDPFAGIESEIGSLTAEANQDAQGIQRQYASLMRELQNMYQLAETEDEKERLRFMLADIEAQKDAGLEALAQGYSEAVGTIRQRAVLSREQTAERSQAYSGQLTQYADESEQRMIDHQAMQVAAGRGLGTNVGMSATNEFNTMQRALPEAQGTYTQRMGDITAEGIDFIGDTTSAQGLAQQGDLQRLAAATRSGTILSHQGGVSSRINQERAAMNDAMLRLSMASISAGGSTSQQPGTLNNLQLREYLASLGASSYSDKAVRNYLEPLIGRRLSPGELAIAAFERQKAFNDAQLKAGNAPAPIPGI